MKKNWEIYRDTGILGGYIPEQAKLRRTEDGEVATVFRDTVTHEEEDCIGSDEILAQLHGFLRGVDGTLYGRKGQQVSGETKAIL